MAFWKKVKREEAPVIDTYVRFGREYPVTYDVDAYTPADVAAAAMFGALFPSGFTSVWGATLYTAKKSASVGFSNVTITVGSDADGYPVTVMSGNLTVILHYAEATAWWQIPFSVDLNGNWAGVLKATMKEAVIKAGELYDNRYTNV